MRWIQILLGVVLLVVAAVMLWNTLGAVRMEVDGRYTGIFRAGPHDGKRLSNKGVMVLKEWVEERTRPVSLDLRRIAWHQLWYNAVTDHYDVEIWVEPPSPSGVRYGIYLVDDTLFLRREYSGRNRVLDTRFTPGDLVAVLEPHLVGE